MYFISLMSLYCGLRQLLKHSWMSFNVSYSLFYRNLCVFKLVYPVLIPHFICLCNEYFSSCEIYGDLLFHTICWHCFTYLTFCYILLQACVGILLICSVSNWFSFFHGSMECMRSKWINNILCSSYMFWPTLAIFKGVVNNGKWLIMIQMQILC